MLAGNTAASSLHTHCQISTGSLCLGAVGVWENVIRMRVRCGWLKQRQETDDGVRRALADSSYLYLSEPMSDPVSIANRLRGPRWNKRSD